MAWYQLELCDMGRATRNIPGFGIAERQMVEKMAGFSFSEPLQTPMNHLEMWFCLFLIIFLMIKEHYYLKIPTRNTTVFFILFPLILLANFLLGVVSENQFIYFQF
jgi:alginate O-acetyltransferase complex protein AlgI